MAFLFYRDYNTQTYQAANNSTDATLTKSNTSTRKSSLEGDKENSSDYKFKKPLNLPYKSTRSSKVSKKEILAQNEDIKKENQKEYIERKRKYLDKRNSANLVKDKMTMFDLIFFNPSSNPMPRKDSQATNDDGKKNL